MDLRPLMVPELRDELVNYIKRPETRALWRTMAQKYGWAGSRALGPDRINFLWREEVRAASAGELFFVSPDMTELARASAATLPGFTMMREDLPAEAGLMVFAHPFTTFDEAEAQGNGSALVHMIAVSWSTFYSEEDKRSGVYLTFYTWREANRASAEDAGMDASALTFYRDDIPRLVHDNEAMIPFGEHVDIRAEHAGTGVATYGAVVISAMLLMQQPGMATSSLYKPNDIDKAKMKRRRMKPQPVRVIQLRNAPTHRDNTDPSGREYHHRWAVRGHWRRQWYPSREDHMPIWIAPHIKGPDGAPLKTGEKVYAWVR